MENIIRNNEYLNNIPEQAEVVQQQPPTVTYADLVPQVPTEVEETSNPPTPVIEEPKQPSNTADSSDPRSGYIPYEEYRKLQGWEGKEEQSKAQERQKQMENVPVFEKAIEGAKWTGETIKNTLYNRPKEMLGGLSHLGYLGMVKPVIDAVKGDIQIKDLPLAGFDNVAEYTGYKDYVTKNQQEWENNPEIKDRALQVGRILADVGENFVLKPLVGQTGEEMLQDPTGIGERLADHIHKGGLLDAYLVLAPTKVGSAINKGIATGVKNTVGKPFENYAKIQQAKEGLRSESIFDKVTATTEGQQWKRDLLDTYRKNNISDKDLEVIFEYAEDLDKGGLTNLPNNLYDKYLKLKPLLIAYDNMIQKYTTATPGNLQEIYQSLVRKSARATKEADRNLSYQVVKDMYEKSKLLELGRYVDRTTGKVIKQDNVLKALSEDGTGIEVGADEAGNLTKLDLRNTDFIIPQENLEILAQLKAEGNPLASHLFDSYGAAVAGDLQRISHGLAPIDKSWKILKKATKNKENYFATERVFGNSSYQDIVNQWVEPENMFKYMLNGVMKQAVTDRWTEEFLAKQKPIVLDSTLPEDIVYVTQNELMNPRMLTGVKMSKLPKERPTGEGYIPIDKHLLQAYGELFGTRNTFLNQAPWLRDLVTLWKRQLLLGGTYLGGNFLGGLHQMITNSNIHVMDDIMSAMKTHGELTKSLGLRREVPYSTDALDYVMEGIKTKGKSLTNFNSALDDVKLATNRNTPLGKGVREAHKFLNTVGGKRINQADVWMQNKFAEIAAHDVLRRKGIRFENRNLDWMRQNMSKMEFYKTLKDIQLEALIYGDETLIPKTILDVLMIGNPFIRWLDQAAQSTIYTQKTSPTAFGYLQGAVLGNLAWSQNEANAKGYGISNPQSGKIYHIDSKTGASKNADVTVKPDLKSVRVSEYGGIPASSAVDAFNFYKYGANTGRFGPLYWLLSDIPSAKTSYGSLKQRSHWGKDWKGDNILPDYQRNVRIKNGKVTDTQEIDEMASQFLRDTVFRGSNSFLTPTVGLLINKQMYQPYSDQIISGLSGNPNKTNNIDDLINKLIVRYEHPAYEGSDYPVTPKKEMQLTKGAIKREAKDTDKRTREQALREDKGDVR